MSSRDNQLYDIYIIEKSGLPVVAGCTGTDYCNSHLGQHELQSGFLAALFAFSKEAFDDETLKSIEMNEIQVNFVNNEKYELILGMIHPLSVEKGEIVENMELLIIEFIKSYIQLLEGKIFREDLHEIAKNLLLQFKFIEAELHSVVPMQNVTSSNKNRIVEWIRNKF